MRQTLPGTPTHVFFLFLFSLVLAFPAPASAVSLLESVEAALAYNPELKAGQERRQAALHALDKARAGFFPRLSAEVGGGFSRRGDSVTRAYNEDGKMRGHGDASLRLIQPIWQGGQTTADTAARQAMYYAADSQLEDSGASLAFQTIVAHVEVLRWTELVELAKKNVKEHEKILGTVRQRYNGEIVTVGERHQVEGRLARAKATLSTYESALGSAQAAYLNSTGRAAANLKPASHPSKSYASLDEALRASLADNKRIQSAMHEVSAAEKEKDLAQSRFFPSVNLEAGPSWRDRDSRYDSKITEVGVGLYLKWDLFNGGEDTANVALAGARIRQSKQNLHTVMDSLGKDIESTYSHYLSAKEQVGFYEAAKKSSRLAKEDYYRQFISAQRSLLDLLDAENDCFFAAGQEAMSRGDWIITGYRLLALSGELLPSLGVDPARLRVNTNTTTEDTKNLRLAFPTPLRGRPGK
ncbi:MAG: TolC family outer membrane protein [Desulfovibrionaceae bacterium]|nr:TolC family outer membrane protein [Desulfovibrionaceae bacterium]